MSIHIDDRTPRTMPESTARPPALRPADRRVIAAIALIAIGVVALIGTFTNSRVLGLSILPVLGLIFLAWGLAARVPGPLIPGGILTGLGLGVLLADQTFAAAPESFKAGIIVLGLALGFAAIAPLTHLIGGIAHVWSLLVGGVLALVSVALMIGGPALDLLNAVSRFWPIVFIALGAYLIWQVMRKR